MATRPVGASGVVRGVAEILPDAAPLPATFIARTLKSYEVPFVKPEISIVVAVEGGLTVTHAPESTLYS